MKPIYTLDNTTPAFQLNWSVGLFGRLPFPPSCDWLEQLRTATEADVYGLQVVMESEARWNEVRPSVLGGSRAMIIRAAAKHIHVLLGAGVTESPAEVALSLMNNLAYAQGMKPTFRFSYYVGTFGPYDRNAVRRMGRR